jgi:hypothetical protein
MNPKQVLTLATARALSNGWQSNRYTPLPANFVAHVTENYDKGGWDIFIAKPHIFERISETWNAEDLLFDTDFAKALWGSQPFVLREIYTNPFANEGDTPDIIDAPQAWIAHLCKLAIMSADDRWEYIGREFGL